MFTLVYAGWEFSTALEAVRFCRFWDIATDVLAPDGSVAVCHEEITGEWPNCYPEAGERIIRD